MVVSSFIRTFSCRRTLIISLALSFLFCFPLTSFAGWSDAILGGLISGSEWLLILSQHLFFNIINFTIFQFGENWQVYTIFSTVWHILRDFVNLIIVILFVVIAMVTISGSRFGFQRKALLGLIFAAVLVNFSAFFTLLIIDISNVFFTVIFNMITSDTSILSPFHGSDTLFKSSDKIVWDIIYTVYCCCHELVHHVRNAVFLHHSF